MKNFLRITILLLMVSFFTTPSMAAHRASEQPVALESAAMSKASEKQLRKQKKWQKRLDRFQNKMNKRINKLKQKGLISASLNMNTISLIVILLGGMFILLGVVIPWIGPLFMVIGIIIAFAGLISLLLLDGVEVSANSGDTRETR